jgi:hypothetical protein
MSRNNGETWGTPFYFAFHFVLHFVLHSLLRDKVPPHDGSVGWTESVGKDCAHIFTARVPMWELQKFALHYAV